MKIRFVQRARPQLGPILLLGLLLARWPEDALAATGSADDQFWNETRLTYVITPQFNIFTAGAIRLVNDFSDVGRTSGRIGLGWQPLANLTIMPSYLYNVDNPSTDASKVESRLCLLTSYKIPVETATLALMNMTEYRMPEGAPASWRLRPRLELSHPLGPSDLAFSGFVANEAFYDESRNVWTQDRVFGGLRKSFGANTEVEVYYGRELIFSSARPDANIIGLNLKFTFGPQTAPPPDEPDLQ